MAAPSPKRGGELLAYLLTYRKSAASRTAIAEAIWPQLEADAVRHRLHLSASGARAMLRLAGAPDDALQCSGGTYALHPAIEIDADVDVFFRQAVGGMLDGARAAAALYTGEYLADNEGEWLEPMRTRCASTYIGVLEQLAADAAAHRRFDVALGYCYDVLGADRGHEGAVRLLMRCYHELGRRSAAIRQYETLLKYLAQHLGVEPAKETTAMLQRVVADDILGAVAT